MSQAYPLILVILLVIISPAFGAIPVPQDLLTLPKVELKTARESFNSKYDVALRNNRVWIRGNEKTPPDERTWRLFGEEGQPPKPFLWGMKDPLRLKEVSADGDNLIVRDYSGQIYYAKFFDPNTWQTRWGWNFLIGSHLYMPAKVRAWAISHRGPEAKFYTCRFGTQHPMSAGVTTLYALAENGTEVFYADPWLNGGFRHRIGSPLRGRFKAVNMSASASTLFVIDRSGQMYTRLIDYDTVGDDPVLTYTYVPGVYEYDGPRGLPNEEWRPQPRILVGRYTDLITIFQNGEGNSARELHVEGELEGRVGYFSKSIDATDSKDWVFHALKAGSVLQGNVVDASKPQDLGPSKDKDLAGVIKKWDGPENAPAELIDFNLDYNDAKIRVPIGDRKVDLTLYTRWLKLARNGRSGTLRGMLVIPEDFVEFDHERYFDLYIKFNEKTVYIESAVYFILDNLIHLRFLPSSIKMTFL